MLSNLTDELTPLQCFIDYVAVKLHFSGDFTWRPDARLKIKEDSLNQRKDATFFHLAAEKYKTREDFLNLMISAFHRGRNFWIGDMANQEVVEYHKKRMRRYMARDQNFRMDAENLYEYMTISGQSLKDLLKKGEVPAIIRHRRKIVGGITDETLACFDFYFDFCGGVKTEDPLWNQEAFKISRYKYFCRPGKEEKPEYEKHIHKLLGV